MCNRIWIRFTAFAVGLVCLSASVDRLQRQLLSRVIMYQTSLPVCCHCLYVVLKDHFDEMMTRHDDAVKEVISNLNAQTSLHPIDAD